MQRAMMAYAYRDLSDDELDRYLTFLAPSRRRNSTRWQRLPSAASSPTAWRILARRWPQRMARVNI